MVLPVVLNVIYGLVFVIGRFALTTGTPVFFTGIRMMIAGIILLSIYLCKEFNWQDIKNISYKDWLIIIALSFFNVYLTNAFEFYGLQYMSAGKASFIYNLTPFITAIISYFLFAEKMTRLKLLGLCIGFLGFFPLIIESSPIPDLSYHFGFLSLAEMAILIATVGTSVGWIIMKLLVGQKYQYSHYFLNGISCMIGAAFCLTHAYIVEYPTYIYPGMHTAFAWYVASLALVFVLVYSLHAQLLKKYTSTLLSFLWFIAPLTSAIFGLYFLGETIDTAFIVSMFIVFVGLALFYIEEVRQGYIT